MRTRRTNDHREASLWNRLIPKPWLQVKKRAERFAADEYGGSEDEPDNGEEEFFTSPISSVSMGKVSDNTSIWTNYIDTKQLRLFVGSWNVAGNFPPKELDIHDWLLASQEAADIYVIGFQEIVPLNAGNVLGNKDGFPAAKWDAMIRVTLNKLSHLCKVGRRTTSSAPSSPLYEHARHFSAEEDSCVCSNVPASAGASPISIGRFRPIKARHEYVRIASKQMVGIFVSVWMRRDLRRHVRAVEVSSVGCGIMGRLGNKGSVSVSLSLHQTSFCFVCSHLKSGDKEIDVMRRNFDVTEILRRTRFPRSRQLAQMNLPETILAHDRIIWFGDLNYRLSMPCDQLRSLVSQHDWETLLKKDQLKFEQFAGRVFEGWREGSITFAPTYKYLSNSDFYAVSHAKEGGKQRSPAWCDRILWYGKGIKQLSYARSESRHSDHRPVRAVFMAELEIFRQLPLGNLSPISVAKVEVEKVIAMDESKLLHCSFETEKIYNLRTAVGSNATVKIKKLTLFPIK